MIGKFRAKDDAQGNYEQHYQDAIDFTEASESSTEEDGEVVDNLIELLEYAEEGNVYYGYATEGLLIHNQRKLGKN